METALLYLSASTIVVTSLVHSMLGERLLIAPMMAMRDGPLQSLKARRVIRFAWHMTSVLMVITAIVLIIAALTPSRSLHILVWIIGGSYLGVGLFDGILTRGKHIGWWFLTAAGCLAVASQL